MRTLDSIPQATFPRVPACRCSIVTAVSLCGVVLCGCAPTGSPQFTPGQAVVTLEDDTLQAAVNEQILRHCGDFAAPKLPTRSDVPESRLKHGQRVYQQHCVQCHGVNGDGQGPAATAMYPRPRDYRLGKFKFTSTTYGSKPLREDLVRTVRRGARGTSMPSFALLPDEEVEAVVDYVTALAQRGELERELALTAEAFEEVDAEMFESESIPFLAKQWAAAREQVVLPLTPQPEFTAEHVRAGREAFLSSKIGCAKCHGEDGRGQTPENLAGERKDDWGHVTRAADLTSGMLHGGQEPMDIYRRIYGGINGTPMPQFANVLQSEPQTIWNLVAYVQYLTDRRRAGETPLPGELSPYVKDQLSATPAPTGG
jgi:mono/diheme cytochrome c family protein